MEHEDPPGKSLLTFEEWEKVGEILELTPREQQVCKQLFLGITRASIADQLKIKSRTVRQFTEQIHTKLQVKNRVGVVLRVIQIRDLVRSESKSLARESGSNSAKTF